jgi:hypothetical protein
MDEGPRVDFFPASRPPGGAAAFAAQGASAARNRWQAKVILHASKEILAPRVPQTVRTLEAIDEERRLLYTEPTGSAASQATSPRSEPTSR